jgi:hypothetical protein
MSVPTQAEVFQQLIHNLREAQSNCAMLSHLTRDDDGVRSHGWLAMSELLGRAVHNVTDLATKRRMQ